jgi:hypothetical protein
MWRQFYETVKHGFFDYEAFFPNAKAEIQKLWDNGRQNVKVEKLVPVDNKSLLNRFEKARLANPHLKVEFGFHGTSVSNIESIKSKGLMVPKTHLEVANGSAHGLGIYIAKNPVISTSYVRGRNEMFVVAVLTGDSRVFRSGEVLVAKDDNLVVPLYVMHYNGLTPGYESSIPPARQLLRNPIVRYISWYLVAAAVFLAATLASYLITGTFLTVTWFIGWGRLPEMRFFEFVFSGGTSSILYYISTLHGFSYSVMRLFFYCMAWKSLKFVLWYIILTPLSWLWSLVTFLPLYALGWNSLGFQSLITFPLTYAIFCFKLIGMAITSNVFYIVAMNLGVAILLHLFWGFVSKLRSNSSNCKAS